MMGTIESVPLNSNNWNTELEKDEEEKLEISELDHHHNSFSYNNKTYFPQSQQPTNEYYAAMPNGPQTASTSSSNFHGNPWSQEFNANNYYIPPGEPIELRHHENPFPFNNQTETEWDPNYKNNEYSNCNAQFPQAQQPINEYYVAMPNGPETGSTSSSNFHGNPCSQEFNDNNFYIPSGEPIGNNSNFPVTDAATKMAVPKSPKRSRMSGAEMKLMTAQDKRQRQREHNKKNSHNLVIRRNEEKKELASRCENLNKQNEYYERIYNNQSAKLLEEYRDEIWPRYWNSSPYGNPNVDPFFDHLMWSRITAFQAIRSLAIVDQCVLR
uniref:Uncharacterized protein n=2 Tax=Caenorhabditis japonica TaxID=281687 RepID=A0A8R1HTW5_CAEJA